MIPKKGPKQALALGLTVAALSGCPNAKNQVVEAGSQEINATQRGAQLFFQLAKIKDEAREQLYLQPSTLTADEKEALVKQCTQRSDARDAFMTAWPQGNEQLQQALVAICPNEGIIRDCYDNNINKILPFDELLDYFSSRIKQETRAAVCTEQALAAADAQEKALEEMPDPSIVITDENFEQEVLQSKGVVIVDYGAEWCEPCERLTPKLVKIGKKYAGEVKIGLVDASEFRSDEPTFKNQRICEELMHSKVESFPYVDIFVDGQWKGYFKGDKTEDELEKIIFDRILKGRIEKR